MLLASLQELKDVVNICFILVALLFFTSRGLLFFMSAGVEMIFLGGGGVGTNNFRE